MNPPTRRNKPPHVEVWQVSLTCVAAKGEQGDKRAASEACD